MRIYGVLVITYPTHAGSSHCRHWFTRRIWDGFSRACFTVGEGPPRFESSNSGASHQDCMHRPRGFEARFRCNLFPVPMTQAADYTRLFVLSCLPSSHGSIILFTRELEGMPLHLPVSGTGTVDGLHIWNTTSRAVSSHDVSSAVIVRTNVRQRYHSGYLLFPNYQFLARAC